jgi:pimeloyl-ACP methyl ester carboxylesterase
MQSTPQRPLLSDEQSTKVIHAVANSFRQQPRAPILGTPADVNLEYEDVTFPSEDGVPLEAWFIPKKGSKKLIIANHPRYFNRWGFPSNIEPWRSMFAAGGNDFEVNLLPDYGILHEADYNVLTYDLRNFGHSGDANGSLCTSGHYESRDVIGSMAYAQSRPDLQQMTIGLFSRCLGCNSTLIAMARKPEVFAHVRCLVGVQPVSARVILERILELAGVPPSRFGDLDQAVKMVTSLPLEEMSPLNASKEVSVPTFLYQVHDDLLTRPTDVQAMFDDIPIKDKKLFWITGTTRRWDGYTYFSKNPAQMLAWFNKHMS